jgi:hypothetical protein
VLVAGGVWVVPPAPPLLAAGLDDPLVDCVAVPEEVVVEPVLPLGVVALASLAGLPLAAWPDVPLLGCVVELELPDADPVLPLGVVVLGPLAGLPLAV